PAHAPGAAVGERGEADEARAGAILGHRRRGVQPARRAGRHGHLPRLPIQARLMSVIDVHPRLLDEVQEGDTLPTLAYDVTATTVVLGALASRDGRPMHHHYHSAVTPNGTQDIFLNTPNQAAWFERYVTDWTGPTG